MNDHQALVSSTWDADQTALRDWVNCIVHAQHQAALRENLESFLDDAAKVIRAELEARKLRTHCPVSSFLAEVYMKLWWAREDVMYSTSASSFEDMVSGLPHLPTLPALFRGDLDAMLEQGKKQCLVQVIHDFVSDKYLEPKYAKTLLKPVWLLPALDETRSLQDEFNRQLQQKKAATEKAPQASTTKVAAINTSTKQVKIHADGDGEASDVEMDDLEKSMENAKDVFARDTISARLVEWRVKKLYSMLEPATRGSRADQDLLLRILRERLSADIGAYRRLRQFMDRLKETKAGKWYCVRSIGSDPGSFRDAERIERSDYKFHTACNTCGGPGLMQICLQFQSIGGRKGVTKVVFGTFNA